MTFTESFTDRRVYHRRLSQSFDRACEDLRRVAFSYFFFHLIFLTLLCSQALFFLCYLALFHLSTFLAFILGSFFLTFFSFLILRVYLQANKPDRLVQVLQNYLTGVKQVIGFDDSIVEHHIALAQSCQKFAAHLHDSEYHLLIRPSFPKSLQLILQRLSAFSFWRDYHQFKELLLLHAIEEHLAVIKVEPVSLEVHAAMANAYVMLSSLCADPRKYSGFDESKWISPERYNEFMLKKFRKFSQLAIEEFKILNDYAPHDPWVHMQLAYSYHDLQMPEEEMKEYEKVLQLTPGDKEILFKLGMLYFHEGKNAEGLRIYEALRRTNYQKAERLIKFYGSWSMGSFTS